jgi:hypothetical protein
MIKPLMSGSEKQDWRIVNAYLVCTRSSISCDLCVYLALSLASHESKHDSSITGTPSGPPTVNVID